MSYGNNRPKFWVLPTIAFLIIFGLGFAVDKAHSAPDTRQCVTAGEFGRLQIGMSRKDVYTHLDGDGKRGESANLREWRICDKYDNPRVIYAKTIVEFNRVNKVKQAYWIIVTAWLTPAPDDYVPEGMVPCDNPPPALPYCDPTLPEDEVVCYNADNEEVECNFRKSLK